MNACGKTSRMEIFHFWGPEQEAIWSTEVFYAKWNVTPLIRNFGGQQDIVAQCSSLSPLPALFLSLLLNFAPDLVLLACLVGSIKEGVVNYKFPSSEILNF